ncbi:MAG TPA: DNA translocase FtsK [Dehalococcoidia bacterium]|nr:DNA translocase FtsK [Dehalococcoidia bacterium]
MRRVRGNPRPSAGRRRQNPSPSDAFFLWLARVETLGLALIFLATAGLATIVSGSSVLGDAVKLFGLHVFTLCALLIVFGVLVWRRSLPLVLHYPHVSGAILPGVLATAGLFGLFEPSWRLAGVSLAGVTAGGDLGDFLVSDIAGVLIWLASSGAFIAIAWPQGVRSAAGQTPGAMSAVWGWRIPHRMFAAIGAVIDFAFPTKPPVDEGPAQTAPAWLPEEIDEEDLDDMPTTLPAVAPESGILGDVTDARLRQAQLPVSWEQAGDDEDDEEALAPMQSEWKLPPMELLLNAAPADESSRPDNVMRASLIVETLASFGVDANVSQYHEGPVVTQFDVEPGWEIKYRQVQERDRDNRPVLDKDGRPRTHSEEVSRTRVRVNQITSLANDLALALAAPSLRIEAPVPGRSVVGIEVPNTAASVVTMRSVIETPAFQRLAVKTKLALPLGKSVSGEPVVADLGRMPHLLIAGATGSGKSVCMNAIIASLLMHSRPEEVRFVMIDPKRVELAGFAMIPHLAFSNIVVDVEKVVGTLGAVLHEMEARYKRFAALAVRNIDAYNKHPKAAEHLPYWVVIIDELADLMMAAPFEVERQICRLAQLARATGIHLIVATQRPSVDVVTGLIKANFPTRIAFAMSSQVDSRTILDMAGAERLLGRGDMLYMPTDASKPKRVQGVYVSDQEIDRLVAFWAQQRTVHSTPVFDHLLEKAQQAIEEEEDADPMYDRAKALAEEHTRVSTSMLQRRLRIGYPRAARIMDRLEEEGLVGESAGGSRETINDRSPFSGDRGDRGDLDDGEPGFRPPKREPWDA